MSTIRPYTFDQMRQQKAKSNEVGHVAWGSFLIAHAKLISAMDEAMEKAGQIPTDWYDVLLALSRNPEGRLRLNQLADCIVFSRSGLTRLLDRLEARDLIRREPVPNDRRGQYAVLTEVGKTALRDAWAVYKPAIEEFFIQHLTDTECATIHRALVKVLHGIGGDPREESEPVQISIPLRK